jgi:hypothetical protein
MRYLRRISTYALLSVYSTTALLGYGLHLLAPDAHHHSFSCKSCVEYADHDHTDHGFRTLPGATDTAVLASGEACHDDNCFVCEFLAQARSATPQVMAAIVWQHVATEVVPCISQYTAQTTLGPHAPRGPPLLAA